ncbi:MULTISPECIES: FMN-binding protein [unclassified Clostridioides]|uniref:FMN-binding protein n=1 Tax=unclassified Clostridioides TaxID=2635829 RepID=UPI001D10DE42|nr:FMN-binding protein [Clostridioides sp. ZZV14-6150]MCC0669115.1 FMN-binding protein [Clostridioides sp. ZZV14-6153]MCC0720411.1 FMN-binding protein [Clostridioides sp. ZZV14-6105]MCC0723070.1 FMN-binding protein [Clostridioides sp. ZZV14-6104]MCC0728497.1 FMN-binding protein [Clostridioides sp. ZZV14-6045]MCC0731041.1 FMN-binding protein [Clostridioides sp. ZZV14-6048]MCC0735427.1 FMN-binding protein [Clostridioides sp. ZZV14-6009]MCC0739136.1 FMN-binding protein [Clostridioides sp. ZZV14
MKVSKKKIIYRIIVIVLLIGLACLGIYLKQVKDYKQTVKNMTFKKVNISDIADGTYVGECNVNIISAKVEVTVKSGKISSINLLEHKNERGKTAEKVIDKVLNKQKVDVDAVSGATNSSKVIKKAIENALIKG